MKRSVYILGVMFFFGTSALLGCKKNNKQATKSKATNKQAPTKRIKPKADTGVWVVKAYEVVRLALAADKLATAKQGAAALAKEVETKRKAANPKDKAALEGMLSAGNQLAKVNDFAKARLTFGELSKYLILFLTRAPSRTKGLTAYQCPMAKGYKKWLQADAQMANPYMGKRMLLCGGKTSMKP